MLGSLDTFQHEASEWKRDSFNQVTQEVSERHLGKKRIYATLFAQVYSDKALKLGDPRQSRKPAMYDLGILKAVTQNDP